MWKSLFHFDLILFSNITKFYDTKTRLILISLRMRFPIFAENVDFTNLYYRFTEQVLRERNKN